MCLDVIFEPNLNLGNRVGQVGWSVQPDLCFGGQLAEPSILRGEQWEQIRNYHGKM